MLTLLFSAAHAFCGFYVGGADAELYNDATLTVLMRDGQRTVLSMQNTYQGPPEDFALVVPVPQVLQEENVKTLPREVFARVDRLAAPRLVEYWERDPCDPYKYDKRMAEESRAIPRRSSVKYSAGSKDLGVTIEAEFSVAEYDIVILSAKDSSGLETWLKREKYNIPDGASSALKPYVASGTKFFVAKVDPERVEFQEGRAVLSPLRVHYDSEQFSLPIRLGLLNSQGEQDLLVHILAKNQRYEVANYDNVRIPTNLRVTDAVRDDFGAFYEALFANTVDRNPNAVVTEYSWRSGKCDPCPGPTLSSNQIATLGGDLLGDTSPMSWTLTRLHYRYGTEGVDEDLVFRKADPLIGGRGTPNAEGEFTEITQMASENQFQGRYAILHRWEGDIACENPQRGVWGGPDGGESPPVKPRGDSLAARETKRIDLAKVLEDPLPGVKKRPSIIPEAE
jgi:hypothetical protein